MITLYRFITALALSCMLMSPVMSYGRESVYDNQTNPSFREAFYTLNEKMKQYNALNDSLFLEENEETWKNFVVRRSITNYENYVQNQIIIDDIIYFFLEPKKGVDATSGNLSPRDSIPSVAYDSLWAAIDDHYELFDPFLTEIFVGKILIPYYSSKDNISKSEHILLSHLYLNYGEALYQIYNMGDESTLKPCYEMLKLSISHSKVCSPDEFGSIYRFYAWAYILSHKPLIEVAKKVGEDIISYLPDFQEAYMKYRTDIEKHYIWSYYRTMANMAFNYKFLSLREMILSGNIHDYAKKAEIEKLLAEVKNDPMCSVGKSTLHSYEYYSTDMLLMAYEGLISYNEAFEYCEKHYSSYLDINSISSFNRAFLSYVNSMRDMLYIIDCADYPLQKKKDFACHVMDMALQLLRMRPKQSIDTRHTAIFMELIKDERLLKYLPEEKRIPYMKESTNVLTIHTLVHTELVEKYASVILQAVFEKCPELLIGVSGTTSVKEVLAKKAEINTILSIGCQFHDVGKLQLQAIVNNEFRKLTDHEFKIIKSHSENCSFLLDLDSKFGHFTRFALGHHKWYDGTKGYPVWYDNTKCKERTLVDIVTIADCLEAATNFMSRNYRRSKPYETMIEEFKSQAGTRYNPYVLDALINSKYYDELGERVRNSRSVIYQQIFRNN